MTAATLLRELQAAGVLLSPEPGRRIRWRGPAGAMTPERRASLRKHRDALLEILCRKSADAASPGTAERARPASEGIPDPSAEDPAAALISLAERAAFPRLDLFGWGVVGKGKDGWRALVHRLDGDAAWLAHATATLRLIVAGTKLTRAFLGNLPHQMASETVCPERSLIQQRRTEAK